MTKYVVSTGSTTENLVFSFIKKSCHYFGNSFFVFTNLKLMLDKKSNNKIKIEKFENHIKENLLSCNFDLSLLKKGGKSVGVAVSGGADSVSLFVALCHLSKKIGFGVKAITVNHNIRSCEESSGDANFVVSLGEKLRGEGFNVSVLVKEIERGKVFLEAQNRASGTEEAARFLRYKAFEDFFASENVDFIALAHNKNDQIETLLMRFLQGSGTAGLCGIKMRRNFYVRPLLDVSRTEIEDYLNVQNINWKTDSTNFDTNYLRNRIRQKLVPFLSENFNGFEKALLSGAKKAEFDENFISLCVEKSFWNVDSENLCANCVFSDFYKLKNAIKIRQIYSALNLINAESRVPFVILMNFIELCESSKNQFKVEFENVELCRNFSKIEIKKKKLVATESCFFVIINSDMHFALSSFFVDVQINKESKDFANVSLKSEKDCVLLKNIPVPFCIRSREQDDFVKTADGKNKSVSDILSDWHICAEKKNSVPIIQELFSKNQEILAICGSVLGFKNWIVKN